MGILQKAARRIRNLFGWILTILAGSVLISSVICTFAAVFGGLEVDSLGERFALFAIFLVLSILSFLLLKLGLRLRRKLKKVIPPPPQPVPQDTLHSPAEPEPLPSPIPAEKPHPEPAAPPKKAPPPPVKKQKERNPPAVTTPYTRASKPYEVPCANRESDWEKESSRFLFLSDAHIAPELDWGESEFFAVNTDTWEPYYIITQYDGAHIARTWYTVKEPVSWEEVEQYASEECRTMLGGKAGAPWKKLAVHRETTPTSFGIRWRISRNHIYSAGIQITGEGFVATCSLLNSTGKDRQASLSFSDAATETAFRKAIRSLSIHKEYILTQLWDFAHHNCPPSPAAPKKVPVPRQEWILLYGHPSGHGDQISLGRHRDGYTLRITNDGYPDRMAGGGIDYAVPSHFEKNGKLNMRQFEAFYREKFPNGPRLDYSGCSCFTPMESPDSEKPKRLKLLHRKDTPLPDRFYTFESDTLQVELVLWKGEHYIRLTKTRCTAENNSRPCWTGDEYLYPVPQEQVSQITKNNWKSFTQGKPAAHNHIVDTV